MIGVFNGVPVGYEDVGTGPAVVFLHGYPHDRTLWVSQLDALAVPSRTVACDLRGFGESGGHATSVDDYADDVAALMNGIGIEQAVIAGLSMGGYVAFALWRKHPSLIRALVLSDTRAKPDDEAGKAKRDEQIAMVRARGSDALADQLIAGMVGKTTRDQRPEVAERVHAMIARAPVEGIIGGLTAMRDRPDSTPTLETIDVPTLILVGDEDVLTPPADSRAMHAAIPKSRLEIIQGAGHLSNLERPANFNHVLGEFLASLAYT
jgi:pimeloyl-ACP methyl ester carboxylesterase